MADLYKGIAGSPITYLTSDITANQTTISIDDDSALPDAPNICTIGYGENLETIKYGVKSNGVLQEVVRGIEGTPRAWQAGTEVARFFTAYDHNSIIENFNSHLAENANKAHGGFRGALITISNLISIPDNSPTILPWGSAIYDTNNFFSLSNPTRLTIPTGVQKVKLLTSVYWEQAGIKRIRILKNGDAFAGLAMPNYTTEAYGSLFCTTATIQVTEGDYFEVEVRQRSGSSQTVSSSISTWFALEVVE